MADLFQIADVPPVSRKRRLAQLILLLLLVTLAALFVEHWRGERALRAWKSEITAQGEIFDPNKLWPAPDPASREFPNRLTEAVGRLPKTLGKFQGMLSGLRLDESGRPIRGSKQARPPLSYPEDNVSTWPELEAASKEAQPALESIRKLMKNPPRTVNGEITKRLELGAVPNLINIRQTSQALHTAVINDLHRGDLGAALENLEALQGCVRVNADDPSLVNYMIRVALIGLASDAGWDALQDDGWTEPQLARFQKACQSNVLFPQMPKALAAERVTRLHSMDWFASHSYQAWIARFADLFKSFGSKPPEQDTATWTRQWRQWIFHPAWSYAWRAQDELDYLQYSQADLAILREAVARGSWVYLKERQTALRNNYRRPPADWRFYRSLPLHDTMSEIVGGRRMELPECPYPNFSRAWFATAKNLTRHEMVTTVIALKRYQLREGKMPKDLAALVPAYLDDLPRDLVNGQPLRYRLNTDGSFVLYSVGEDARDDRGDSRPAESSTSQQSRDCWAGRDWVWPEVVPSSSRRKI
jgi:hypothetical protein